MSGSTMKETDVAVECNGVVASREHFLSDLHCKGLLVPFLHRFFREEISVQAALDCGLRIAVDELQRAVDLFRRRRGLRSAAATHRWLKTHHLSAAQFEARIERWLLIEKLKDRIAEPDLESEFRKRSSEFDVVEIREALAPTQDAAHEMGERLREGMDFSDAARRFASPAAMARAFQVARRFRRELSLSTAEALFAAKPGDFVGPIAEVDGFVVIQVVSIAKATLDSRTQRALRKELFARWISRRLENPIRYPILESLEPSLAIGG
jgi:hypothetical protein